MSETGRGPDPNLEHSLEEGPAGSIQAAAKDRFAANAAGDVKLAPVGNAPASQNRALVTNSVLQVGLDGAAVVRFFDVEDPQVKSWDLTVDKHGRLLRVAVTPVHELKLTLLP